MAPPLPRVVVPEILDTLNAADPEAIRSREDLRRLDKFLGGSRWVLRTLAKHRHAAASGIVELGAGDGRLCNFITAKMPGCLVAGLDLAVRPDGLHPGTNWKCGDFFQTLPTCEGGVVVGSLILHHFDDADLSVLGKILAKFRVLIFSEPHRDPWSILLSRMALPFVGKVTRHDMTVSLRAGFRRGEIASVLGLDKTGWRISETSRMTGVLRFEAWRD